jgi:hypothetical protein
VARQFFDEASILQKIVAAMQKKQRRTLSGCQHLERNLTDLDALHRVSFSATTAASKPSLFALS